MSIENGRVVPGPRPAPGRLRVGPPRGARVAARVALRWLALVQLALLAGVAAAAPASADPAEPTDDRARVTGVQPAVDGVTFDVVGGDSFLRGVVEPGHEVTVFGYEGEPYLRFGPDGVVEENRRSPAAVLNESRYGTGGDLAGTDPDAEPEWTRVADGGSHVWHDHRIHWMAATEPPQLAGADTGRIMDWQPIPLLVDGTPASLHGELVREAPPALAPWLAVSLVVAAAAVASGWRRPTTGTAAALLAAAGLALVTSLVAELGVPAETGRRWAVVAVAALAAVCALAAVARPRSRLAPTLVLGAGLVLVLWLSLRWGVLRHAVLPTPTAAWLQRAAVAGALGAVLGAAVPAARAALPPLSGDGDERAGPDRQVGRPGVD